MSATASAAASLRQDRTGWRKLRSSSRVSRWSVTTWIAPSNISQPVAPRNPPITGYGTKRIARPARVKPSTQSRSAGRCSAERHEDQGRHQQVGVLPLAIRFWAMTATSAAVTAEVEVSGPAIANGSELRSATTAAADRGRQERDGDAVGQPRLERAGEDQRRVGQAIGNREDAADRAGEDVPQGGMKCIRLAARAPRPATSAVISKNPPRALGARATP